MRLGAVLADPGPMLARLVRSCIALALSFTACVLAVACSHHLVDTVKGGELSYMAVAMEREHNAFRSLLMVAGAVLANPERMLARLVRGCTALAFTACVPADQSSHRHANAVKGRRRGRSPELSGGAVGRRRSSSTAIPRMPHPTPIAHPSADNGVHCLEHRLPVQCQCHIRDDRRTRRAHRAYRVCTGGCISASYVSGCYWSVELGRVGSCVLMVGSCCPPPHGGHWCVDRSDHGPGTAHRDSNHDSDIRFFYSALRVYSLRKYG